MGYNTLLGCVVSFVGFALAAVVTQCSPPSARVEGEAAAGGAQSYRQVMQFEHNILQDVSDDGRRLLFYQTGEPTRVSSAARPAGEAQQPGDVLRVVEREGGREVARVKVNFFPESAQFVPGSQTVFYKEPSSDGLQYRLKTWDFSTGESKACADADAVNFRHAAAVGAGSVVGAVLQREGGEALGRLSLPGCATQIAGPVNPSDPKAMTWGGLRLSPDKRHLAYGTGASVVVREAATLRVAGQLSAPAGLIFGGSPLYTPDGKTLLVFASNTAVDTAETKRYLLFYDAATYEALRRLDITSWSPPRPGGERATPSSAVGTAAAVSPDGLLLAIGLTAESRKGSSAVEQAQVVLYDLASGREAGRVTHQPVGRRRNDPFAAKVTRLAFTPDGKYLLSSTYDTLVWQLG